MPVLAHRQHRGSHRRDQPAARLAQRVAVVFRREFRSYFQTPLAAVFLVIFLFLAGLFTFNIGGFYERNQADLRPFFQGQPWLDLFLVPALSMRLWAEDRRTGTVELLLTLPFSVMVSASLFLSIPKELEEAAWTLGCTRSQAFLKVVLPLALPGLAATAIFAFITSWNEVFAASVLTLQNKTLTAFLLSLLDESPLPFKFAGGFFLVVPALVFIFAVRRYLFTLWGIASR